MKNLFKNIKEIEKDYRLAKRINKELDYDELTKKEYMEANIEEADATSSDIELLKKWIVKEEKNDKDR